MLGLRLDRRQYGHWTEIDETKSERKGDTEEIKEDDNEEEKTRGRMEKKGREKRPRERTNRERIIWGLRCRL